MLPSRKEPLSLGRQALSVGRGSATLGAGGGYPMGTWDITAPDPVLYSNPGKGIVLTGSCVPTFMDNKVFAVDGEGKSSEASPGPKLWSIVRMAFDPYANPDVVNPFTPEAWIAGSDLMAGLFEDGSAPNYSSGVTPVVPGDYGGQGLTEITANGSLVVTIFKTGPVVWLIEFDPTTGARLSAYRTTISINHYEHLNLPLSPARGISLPVGTSFAVRKAVWEVTPLQTVGVAKVHGLTNIDMNDVDYVRSLHHVTHGASDADGNVSTFNLDTASAAGETIKGTYVVSGFTDIESTRRHAASNARFFFGDRHYHVGAGTNLIRYQRPDPLEGLYP